MDTISFQRLPGARFVDVRRLAPDRTVCTYTRTQTYAVMVMVMAMELRMAKLLHRDTKISTIHMWIQHHQDTVLLDQTLHGHS